MSSIPSPSSSQGSHFETAPTNESESDVTDLTDKIMSRYEERLGQMVSLESGYETGLTATTLRKVIAEGLQLPIKGHSLINLDGKDLQAHRISQQHLEIVDLKNRTVLGRGSYGIVFNIFSFTQGRPIAVKVLMQYHLSDSQFSELMEKQERRQDILKLLHKDKIKEGIVLPAHVVRVFLSDVKAVGTLQNRAVGSLLSEDVIDILATLSLSKRMKLCCQLLEGMQALKENHVLHRDLKTANILLFEKTKEVYECRLADFDEAVLITDIRKQVNTESVSQSLIFNIAASVSESSLDNDVCRATMKQDDYTKVEQILYKKELFALSNSIVTLIIGKSFIRDEIERALMKIDQLATKINLSNEIKEDLSTLIQGIKKEDPNERFTSEVALEHAKAILQKLSTTPPENNSLIYSSGI
jgi:serine/threonine protein kinase